MKLTQEHGTVLLRVNNQISKAILQGVEVKRSGPVAGHTYGTVIAQTLFWWL